MSRGLGDCVKPPPNMSIWLGILCWPPSFNKQRVRNRGVASFKRHKAKNAENCLKTCLNTLSPMDETTNIVVVFQGLIIWFHYFKGRFLSAV